MKHMLSHQQNNTQALRIRNSIHRVYIVHCAHLQGIQDHFHEVKFAISTSGGTSCMCSPCVPHMMYFDGWSGHLTLMRPRSLRDSVIQPRRSLVRRLSSQTSSRRFTSIFSNAHKQWYAPTSSMPFGTKQWAMEKLGRNLIFSR